MTHSCDFSCNHDPIKSTKENTVMGTNNMATYQFSNEELIALRAICLVVDTHVSRAQVVTINAILASRNSRG